MAITKAKATETAKEYLASESEKLEAKIDKQIADHYHRDRTVSIDISGIHPIVIDIIKSTYHNAGWLINEEHGHDQREQISWHKLILS